MDDGDVVCAWYWYGAWRMRATVYMYGVLCIRLLL